MKRQPAFALILLLVAGCSTVEERIKGKPYAYAQLSPADQALVRSGQVRNGFTRDQVYLAWGSPDRVISGFRYGHPYEAWVYTTYRTVYSGYYYPAYAFRVLPLLLLLAELSLSLRLLRSVLRPI